MKVTDKNLEVMVANILRAGVTLAGIVVLVGGILFLVRHGADPVDYHAFKVPAEIDRLVPDIVAGAIHLRARSVIQLGILLLIATPILRVAFSLVGFLLERDRQYFVITAIVLGVLLYSLISGGAGG